jgi:hypothetical protein
VYRACNVLPGRERGVPQRIAGVFEIGRRFTAWPRIAMSGARHDGSKFRLGCRSRSSEVAACSMLDFVYCIIDSTLFILLRRLMCCHAAFQIIMLIT